MGYVQKKYQYPGYDGEDDFGGNAWEYGSYYRRPVPKTDLKKVLEPLIRQLEKYDNARLLLEQYGGDVNRLQDINDILTREIDVHYHSMTFSCSLADPGGIESILFDYEYAEKYSLHIDVRRNQAGMPVYFLCRTYKDYGWAYGCILENVYKSPGYFSPYDEFVKLMHGGHEIYYLDLSGFHQKVKDILVDKKSRQRDRKACDVLFKLAIHIFQDAWHEDQIVAKAAGRYFGLPNFRQAIDLLYLCLSGDLCELRGKIDEQMVAFFRDVYPHKALLALLTLLKNLDGSELANLNQNARKLYIKLVQASADFLSIKVRPGSAQAQISIQKLILGNLFRLDTIWKTLHQKGNVKNGTAMLEKTSKDIINELFQVGAPATSFKPGFCQPAESRRHTG